MNDYYGYSNSEWILKEILDCGLCDLSIINNAGVGATEYLESTDMEYISLADFVRYVFDKANETLKKEWNERREDILSEIDRMHQENIKLYGEDYMTKFADDDDVQTILFYLKKADDVINNGLSLYFNYLDTHISIPYSYELDKFNLLDEVNALIGFTDIECGCC